MIKKFLMVGSLLFVTLSANAFELKVPKLGDDKGAAASGNIEADVADFVGKSAQLREIAYNSMLTILAAYANEEQLAKLKAADEEMNKKTNTNEKGAAQTAMIKTMAADLETIKSQKDAAEKTKSLTAEKQKRVAKGLFSLAVAALQAPSLMDKGQKIISGVSLTNAMKVLPVKDSLPMLADFVKYGGGTVAGFVKLAKGANIEVKPATADGKPEVNRDDTFKND
jgi:hypothetical protein